MNKLYLVYASRIDETKSTVRYYFHSEEKAMTKYNRLKNELQDVVKNVCKLIVKDAGQKTED